ncbi:DNA repair protein RecN (Recombination protein N) [Tessaracoccus bendigoensis DSM 12906]|uniref:DNA repair protein RecN n=1 Tax=Tessaracoccus bendigoensis DSM 12906 TaxID=1123357 RepID=A0A1M6LJA5_9ACTN|nr:DNA repair protein RecN [Tessaracoccus bendigoensis]SHJ71208.1 DNA repair protein RecN (Recombination protein N) [Tessaracoccus bendigoensis DSM 12906]
MLTTLRLTAFGVVDGAELDLGPGLTALTGETGAGKTMIVSGLGHLLGARADAGIVRRGADKAVVEGRWEVPPGLAARITELGGTVEDGEVVTLRQVAASGRSRAVVGGAGVPVSALADLLSEVATIHGQSGQMRLSTPERQRELLDTLAAPPELPRYQANFAERRIAAAELSQLESESQARAREVDMLRFGLDEIEAVAPHPGEDDALSGEQARLMDLDELRRLAGGAHEALSGDEADYDAPSVVSLTGATRKLLTDLADRDADARDLASRATELGMFATDLAADVAGYLDDLVADPLRLEAVGLRRQQLAGLTRKYGASIDEVLAWAEQSAARLNTLDGSDVRIVLLRDRIRELDAALESDAAAISTARHRAAGVLAEAVKHELAALAMPNAELRFDVTAAPLGPNGADRIELMFSANPGSDPAPLGKVASGGELSRVRLALEVVLAEGASSHTFVFDEVDAGVGGAVGIEIGRRLQRLARRSQVIVVTHLAQVAAFADAHFVVAKANDGQVTTSGVRRLDDAERAGELARMMGGDPDSRIGVEHAAELLTQARGR